MATINGIGLNLIGQSGTGAVVGTVGATLTSPALVTPALGTPASGNLANCTGYPSSGISGVLPIANGGTGVASLPTVGGVSAYAAWNAQGNIAANNFLSGYTTTTTAAGTTTLVVGSAQQQYFTGSTTQTVTLPVSSTLVLGQQFNITNLSSGVVTVNSSGANLVKAMATNTNLVVTCILTSGTTAASWAVDYTNNAGTGGTVTSVGMTVPSFLSVSGSPVTTSGTFGVTLSGTALPIANGGTGLTTTPAANQILIGTGSAYALNTLTSDFGNTIDISGGFCSINTNGQIPSSLTSTIIGTHLTPNVNYIHDAGFILNLPLPATSNIGDWIRISGLNASSWEIKQSAGQSIYNGASTTTVGVTGKLSPVLAKTSVLITCVDVIGGVGVLWCVNSSSGALTYT